MKKVIYSLSILSLALIITSCNKDDNYPHMESDSNIETKAASLGFVDTATYQTSVATQHAAGNHANCDILSDGTHKVCTYSDHSGVNHDGTTRTGTGHGTHTADGQHNDHGTHTGGGQHNDHGATTPPVTTPPTTTPDAGTDTATRAAALGFGDASTYQTTVATQHAAGNHENCDILSDGSHAVCTSTDHAGVNHDGTTHTGTSHGAYTGGEQGTEGSQSTGQNHNDGQDHNNGKNHN